MLEKFTKRDFLKKDTKVIENSKIKSIDLKINNIFKNKVIKCKL